MCACVRRHVRVAKIFKIKCFVVQTEPEQIERVPEQNTGMGTCSERENTYIHVEWRAEEKGDGRGGGGGRITEMRECGTQHTQEIPPEENCTK